MKLFVLFVASWAVGVVAYAAIGSLLDGRLMGSGDFSAAALYSGIMFAITAPVLYLPAIWWGRRLTLRAAALVIALATIVQSFGATALIFAGFGGFRWTYLWKPEAILFYAIFGTAGIVLGIGFLRGHRSRSA
jgi:hypothetical protein